VRREESWEVEGVILTLLRHITAMGFTVSVFRLPRSLYGTSPASVEMHAVDTSKEPPIQHVPRVGEVEGGEQVEDVKAATAVELFFCRKCHPDREW
jgi:hypothetical protein